MGQLVTFLMTAFCVLVVALVMSAYQVPVGTNAHGDAIVITHRPLGFCLAVAFVIAVLVTILLHAV